MTNLSKVTVSFLFVPRKKAWERRCAWPQALERWPGRLFAIKLRINGGFEMFFSLYFDHSPLLHPPSEQVSIWGSYGRDEARAPDLSFANAWKRWCNRSVHFFRSKNIFSTPTATFSNVVVEL